MTPALESQTHEGQVERFIFDEHQQLRLRLKDLDASLVRVAAGSGQAFVDARRMFLDLLVAFGRHLEHEESLLVPVLARLDAWGPVRLEQLLREHADQRGEIAQLASLDAETSAGHWAALMGEFSGRLRKDMASEDHDFLGPNALSRPGLKRAG